jgi:hypothetical protein
MEVLTHPDEIEPDSRPSRHRYVRAEIGPSAYLTVVVEVADDGGVVITAFGHRNRR